MILTDMDLILSYRQRVSDEGMVMCLSAQMTDEDIKVGCNSHAKEH